MQAIQRLPQFDVLSYTQNPYGPARSSMQGLKFSNPESLHAATELGSLLQQTSSWLSQVLVTPTHKEARVTAFLSTWAYERYWLGDALLALAGVQRAPQVKARRSPKVLLAAIMANVRGRALIALQSTQRLVDCWIFQALLVELIDSASVEVAVKLEQIVNTLEKQGAFFFEVAMHELEHSAAARRLTRSKLSRETWPLGADNKLSELLLGKMPDSIKAVLSQQVQNLPGLTNLELRGIS